ncbi:hypothetical protein MGG_17052 [Pyricularia oryzae 70-15]|uniref:DNA repair exonuclease rad1 n=1 Tax=Pyricularia oryzae (strain 70-15 / ATCC MYA-4617 / FGSC 8958) TaxID=242507 RepID=G4N6S2_PYRO7|nr:uncharacterized protein MGG_17052 [Pyricularia oryzae 70-15]EHA49889.1 hypothetical protein MGG_17052 [Pyricularia oryzae 70-15]
MDSSLYQLWQESSSDLFQPALAKGNQTIAAALLLALGITSTGLFALNRSFINIVALGVPASLALASQPGPGVFRAVTSSTRPLHQLLRAISFTNKIHVEISEDGIRFTAEHARVMQGVASLNKALFSSFVLNLPEAAAQGGEEYENTPVVPNFQISLPALIETLQLFGLADAAVRQAKTEADPYRSNLRNYRPDAFSNQTLGVAGTCCLSYSEEGAPFSINMEEAGVNTTCNLVTYLPDAPEDIPFDREGISFKIIMQSRWLLDALAELAPTSPNRLTITASKREPFLRLSGSGPLGSSSVDFSRGRDLLETFSVRERWAQSFKFDIIKSASEAMRISSKVSLRGDGQGVLNFQFMVEVEGGGMQWLEFRFVPYLTREDDEEDDAAAEDDEEEDDQE